MPAVPTSCSSNTYDETPASIWTYGVDVQQGSPGIHAGQWEQSDRPKYAWTRLSCPIVAGYPLTPFTRAAFAGDVISALTHWGTAGLHYINADYTITLSRLPEGEFIGLAAYRHDSSDGVAAGAAAIFDRRGALGAGVTVALAQPEGTFQPLP
jgi:hypothetical protein